MFAFFFQLTNCGCIKTNDTTVGTATAGVCDGDVCPFGGHITYLLFIFLALFLIFTIAIPSLQATIRIVLFSQRSFAVGVQVCMCFLIRFMNSTLRSTRCITSKRVTSFQSLLRDIFLGQHTSQLHRKNLKGWCPIGSTVFKNKDREYWGRRPLPNNTFRSKMRYFTLHKIFQQRRERHFDTFRFFHEILLKHGF